MVYGLVKSQVADLLEVCIQIETARGQLYYDLLRLFSEPAQVRLLWWNLCDEAYRHTAALTFIKGEVELEPEVLKLEFLDEDQDRLDHLLRLVERYKRRVRGGHITLDGALKMAVRLRTCGVENLYDRIFNGVDPIIGEMATRSLRPIQHGWIDLAKTIESCSTDEILLSRVRRLMRGGGRIIQGDDR